MPDTSPPPRGARKQVQLPIALHREFTALCEANGVTSATLLYAWLISAARVAAQGRHHHLPGGGRPPRGSVGEVVGVPWKQGDAEYEQCRRYLAEAGTDPTAVLRAAVAAYIAADGDIVMMDWPPSGPARLNSL